jgi:MarR-like DNA-binding transcriptional regulator SgrR of sgrS sRNA
MAYTQEEEKALENYPEKSVPELSAELNKTERSIIAKLSKMQLYQKAPRTSKNGDPVVSKLELVQVLEHELEIQLSTLVKAGKEDLKRLVEALT